jgi:DNA-binding NtrC family response regulator
MKNILIIDDEPSILVALEFSLNDIYKVQTSSSVPEAFAILENKETDLILLDQRRGEYDGLEVLINIKKKYPYIPVISMTAYGSIESSIKAMQNGAYYYITKPLDLPGLRSLISKALDYQILEEQVAYLKQELSGKYASSIIIGKHKAMANIIDTVERIKDLNVNVLITGESGTGKEVIARAVHYSGERAERPLQIINCAAIPYNLLESELFGYEKGAFTGASVSKKGRIELAQGGDVFLDEIGDMEMGLQAKLLRVIQERKISRLGSEGDIDLDVRFIAATNKDLKEEILKGKFREDLYYRLNVISLHMPALRERKEDIPAFIIHFLEKFNKKFNKNIRFISPEAGQVLKSYDYPGNVRELENIMERAVALSHDETLNFSDLPGELVSNVNTDLFDNYIITHIGESLREAEKKLTLATLKHFKGNKRKAAEVLGLSERHLRTKIKEYEDEIPEGEIFSDRENNS